jgi:hypothetical protein
LSWQQCHSPLNPSKKCQDCENDWNWK